MSDVLCFSLRGPLASWGEIAVGRVRPSADRPTRSALIGLLAGALGVRRDDEGKLNAMTDGYQLAVACVQRGTAMEDFHTMESLAYSAIRSHKPKSRADETRIVSQLIKSGHSYKSMIPTRRNYREDVVCQVLVHGSEPYSLEDLLQAIRYPKFVPYLGRKSCPLSAPMNPVIDTVENTLGALTGVALYWDDGFPSPIDSEMTFTRNDQLRSRSTWEYGTRVEHYAVLEDL
jgi:CRISPR system Cascade subunit CasD